MQVNIFEAKNRLSQLIKAALAGEEVVIANRGQPIARLVPIDAPPASKDKSVTSAAVTPPRHEAGFLQWLNANPLPAYLRRSAQEIDASIEDERNAWD